MKIAIAAALLGFALTASAQSAPSNPSPAALIAALATPSGTLAGPESRALVFPVGRLRAQLANSIDEAKSRGEVEGTLRNFGTYKLVLSVRGRSGGAEVHPHWSDVLIVEQGSAILITGGRVIDGHTGADGEIRGTRIDGGRRQSIGAGDILTIPAGIPQQILLSPGTVMSAFVIRVHQP